MSVEYITGNVLDFPAGANVLAHAVNSLGVMGAGVAKQIAEEYPAALAAYMEAHAAGQLTLGSFTVAEVAGGKRVVNLVVQERIGTDRRQVDYEAVYFSLDALHTILKEAHAAGRVYTLCMPWVGCGLAGGSRAVIRAMVETIFGDSPVRCVVVTRPGEEEPSLSA